MPLRIFLLPSSTLLTDHRPHGDGLAAFGFIRELGRRGHDLHVAAGCVDLRGATLPPNVRIHVLGGGGGPAAAARLRFMWRAGRLYRQLASRAGFDVVHQVTPVEVGVTLALPRASAPVVLGPYVPDWVPGEDAATVQGPAALTLKGRLRAADQRRATTVLLSNPAARSKLAAAPPKGVHVHELPLGIDERAWLPPDGDRTGRDVLFLASLDVRKGIYVALDAFARLAPRFPDARLRVAGGGPELQAVRRRIASTPGLDRVELLGNLERDEAAAVMQACDVYCLPSYGDPNPLVVLEAMACAKPVVTTDSGGLRYLVADDGGRRVPTGDAAALAGALGELLGDPDLRRAMGAHNRRVVEERYAWPRVVGRLEDLYAEAIGGRGSVRATRDL